MPDLAHASFLTCGCLVISMQENYPGEYIDFAAFNSMFAHCPKAEDRPHPKFVDETPQYFTDKPHEPDGQFINVVVDFKLHNLTAEFPTVSSTCTSSVHNINIILL